MPSPPDITFSAVAIADIVVDGTVDQKDLLQWYADFDIRGGSCTNWRNRLDQNNDLAVTVDDLFVFQQFWLQTHNCVIIDLSVISVDPAARSATLRCTIHNPSGILALRQKNDINQEVEVWLHLDPALTAPIDGIRSDELVIDRCVAGDLVWVKFTVGDVSTLRSFTAFTFQVFWNPETVPHHCRLPVRVKSAKLALDTCFGAWHGGIIRQE